MKKDAVMLLKKAIALHEKHMNGTAPTSDKSQMEMMMMMKESLAIMQGGKNMLAVSDKDMKNM